MIKVDGKTVTENCPVTSANKIEVAAKTGLYTPMK
jgi:23S rRNA pseudouridine2605 synthase